MIHFKERKIKCIRSTSCRFSGVFYLVSLLVVSLFGLLSFSSNTYATDYSITSENPSVEIYNMNKDTSGWSYYNYLTIPSQYLNNKPHYFNVYDSQGNLLNYNSFYICNAYYSSSKYYCENDGEQSLSLATVDRPSYYTWRYISTYDGTSVENTNDYIYYDSGIFENSYELYYYIEISAENFTSYDISNGYACPYNYYPDTGGYQEHTLISGSCEDGLYKAIYKVKFNNPNYNSWLDLENDRILLNVKKGSNYYSWGYRFFAGNYGVFNYDSSSASQGVLFTLRQIAWSYTQEDLEEFLESNNTGGGSSSDFPYGYGSDNANNNKYAFNFLQNIDISQFASIFDFGEEFANLLALFPNMISVVSSIGEVEPIEISYITGGSGTYNCPANLQLFSNLSGANVPSGGDLGFLALPFNIGVIELCDTENNKLLWSMWNDAYFPNEGWTSVPGFLSMGGLAGSYGTLLPIAFIACLYLTYLGIRSIIRSLQSLVEYLMGFGFNFWRGL